ncbi:hypothetical protein PIB30_057641 [Stylosanthes scabra]|uniref:Uncharacterized protein n=1 Tax=Stylosanthes scabra TaxID=79078 RepID=A0ABU6WN22_9FABA|nr:hypothetical protein [Stylosanthes scabra]
MAALFNKKRKGKAVAESSNEAPRFKTPFHETHFKGKLSARKVLPELAIDYNDEILSPCATEIKMRKWEKLTSPLPAVGHNLIIAEQFYKLIYKTDLSSSLPFPSIIAALCLDAKVVPHKDDTMIPQEIPITGEAMVRTRETRSRQPRQPRQEVPPPQQPPQVHQQHELPPSFYTHFDASMSQIYRRLDQQQEENRKIFEAINTRMDRMDDQLTRQFREMEAQGVPVTIANLTIHRHKEDEMNRERTRQNQTVQEAASQRAREANKGKAREVVPDSEEEESEEMYSSPSEEW